MENFYSKSLNILREKNPHLYSQVTDSQNNNFLTTLESKAGGKVPAVNISGKSIFLHSKFDPYKEAERFISEIKPAEFDLFIIFGFGFAYHIEELAGQIKENSAVLIIEKEPVIIREAIEARDLSKIIEDERIHILADPDEAMISNTLTGISSRKVSFLVHRGSFQVDPDYYSNMRAIVKSFLSVKDVNIATLSRFEKIWMSNITRNIREFITLPGAGIFYNKFKNYPAIIAGAGPSLNDSIEFIRINQDRAVIICVDTAYKILIQNKINPHFCLTVDAQLINARYFEGCKDNSTIFIADPSAHPSAFRLINGKKCVFSIPFDMMKWIEEITGTRGELCYGGSVSTNAYDFAKRLGTSPVILTGQDMAFTGNLAHARGSYLDEEMFFRTSRLSNADMRNRFQLTALPKIYVRSIACGNVATNQKLMIFLNWFSKRNDPELVNAGNDGAFINNVKHEKAENIKFSESDFDLREFVTGIYEKSKLIDTPENSEEKILKLCREMISELEELLPALKRADSLSGDLIQILKTQSGKEKIDYILKKLAETDIMLESKSKVKDVISFTIQRVIHTINEGYEIDSEDEQLTEQQLTAKKSNYLYKGILEGCEFNLKKLNKIQKLLAG